jgi:DNA oxidative demethylase
MQLNLFNNSAELVPGFTYQPNFISARAEQVLLEYIAMVDFGQFVMKGVAAKRQVRQYGWSYSFASFELTRTEPLPDFLLPVRKQAADLVRQTPEDLSEALLTYYPAGAAIGWHRDAAPFGLVIGISLLAACRLRLRPLSDFPTKAITWELAPRSIYIIKDQARSAWQHAISPVKRDRYSITFRTIKNR